MHIHSVLSHPSRNSLNGALYDAANKHFLDCGHTVTQRNVFEASGNVLESANMMYTGNYLRNWYTAAANKKLTPFVHDEIKLIKEADMLYIQTPIWVYALPGMLKCYIEQVFVADEFFVIRDAHSETEFVHRSLIKNKKVLFGLTLGGCPAMVADIMGSVDNLIAPIRSQFKFIGFEFLDPYITWASAAEFSGVKAPDYIGNFNTYLQNNFK